MTRTEAKNVAKHMLRDAIGTAYYKLEEPYLFVDTPMNEEEEKMVLEYINKYGKAACKAFGVNYTTY